MFRYNSGGKQFSPVPTKHFSVQCDAVTILSHFWATRKQSNPIANVAQIGAMNSAVGGGNNMLSSPMSNNHNHNTLRR